MQVPAIPGAEASEQLARVHDDAGAALTAFRQAGEQVLRSAELPEIDLPWWLPTTFAALKRTDLERPSRSRRR